MWRTHRGARVAGEVSRRSVVRSVLLLKSSWNILSVVMRRCWAAKLDRMFFLLKTLLTEKRAKEVFLVFSCYVGFGSDREKIQKGFPAVLDLDQTTTRGAHLKLFRPSRRGALLPCGALNGVVIRDHTCIILGLAP